MSKKPAAAPRQTVPDVRVNLLPTEIAAAERAGAQRRMIVFLAIISVLVVVLGTVAATFAASTAHSQLATEEARSQALLEQRAQYYEAQLVAGLIVSTEDAERVGAAIDVDWVALIGDILSVTPSTITIVGVDGESSTITIPASGPVGPLEGERLGLVRLESAAADSALVDQWVRGLETLDGYVGSSVQRVENTESDAGYKLAVTVYFDQQRLRERYPFEGAATADESTTDEQDGGEG